MQFFSSKKFFLLQADYKFTIPYQQMTSPGRLHSVSDQDLWPWPQGHPGALVWKAFLHLPKAPEKGHKIDSLWKELFEEEKQNITSISIWYCKIVQIQ